MLAGREVVPGTEDYRRRVLAPGGFVLPNGARERRFATASGRARFTVHPIPDLDPGPGRYLMMTIRSHDQYNTTIYGLNDRYRGIGMGRRIIFLNPHDMKARKIAPVSMVDITSHWQDGERKVEKFYAIPYETPRGTAAAYFPEANPLVPVNSTALESNTPTSKSIEISVEASAK